MNTFIISTWLLVISLELFSIKDVLKDIQKSQKEKAVKHNEQRRF